MSGDDVEDVLSFAAAEASDRASVIGTLVSAFIDDPVERWLWPEAQQYLTHFPRFIAAFGVEAFTQQVVWALPGFAAVAWWIPPGFEPDREAIVAVLKQSVSPQKHEDTFAALEQMDAAHPTKPHWYLPWLGDRLSAPAGRTGRPAAEVVSGSRRRRSSPRVLGYAESPDNPVLRESRVRGHSCGASGGLPTCDQLAPIREIADGLASAKSPVRCHPRCDAARRIRLAAGLGTSRSGVDA